MTTYTEHDVIAMNEGHDDHIRYYLDNNETPTGKIIYDDGEVQYVVDGLFHREDGPGIVYPDGSCDWFLNDIEYTFDDYARMSDWTDEQIIEWKLTHAYN